jgi:heme A synthase
VVVSAVGLLTFAQAFFAGSFLAGHFDMLAVHRLNSTVTVAATALMVVTAVLLWRPGRGPLWPAIVSLLFFATLALQTFLGYRRVLAVHIPLGTTLIAALLLLVVWVWRPVRRPEAVATPAPEREYVEHHQ